MYPWIMKQQLSAALPWLLVFVLGLSIWYISPFGRSLIRYLREARRDAELSEALLTELNDLRASLHDVIERLDSTEQALARTRQMLAEPSESHPLPLRSAPESRLITPH